MEYEKIKQLIEEMGNSKLTEVDIEFPDGTKISMKKDRIQETVVQAVQDTPTMIPNTTIEVQKEKKGNIIKSPMVGTFYLKPSPGTTFLLNFILSIPPNKAFFPLFSSIERIATAPVCAKLSAINTPGIIGLPGK